jgi:hypothetical protein
MKLDRWFNQKIKMEDAWFIIIHLNWTVTSNSKGPSSPVNQLDLMWTSQIIFQNKSIHHKSRERMTLLKLSKKADLFMSIIIRCAIHVWQLPPLDTSFKTRTNSSSKNCAFIIMNCY